MSDDPTAISSLTRQPLFPEQCPNCGRGRGIPLTVTVGAGSRTIGYHCPKCEHEWTAVVPEIENS